MINLRSRRCIEHAARRAGVSHRGWLPLPSIALRLAVGICAFNSHSRVNAHGAMMSRTTRPFAAVVTFSGSGSPL
jgi:hypothetical protein